MPPPRSAVRARPEDLALLVLLSAIWGSSFLFIKLAVATIPPVSIMAGRVLIAALMLALYLRARRIRLPATLIDWWPYAVIGLTGNVLPFTLVAFGETRIGSGLAAILIGTMPLFTFLLAHRFTADERMTPGKLAGVAVGLVGVVVLVGPDALRGLGADVLAQVAVAGAALSYAGTMVFARRLAGVPPPLSAGASIIAAAVAAVPLALVVDRPWGLAPGWVELAALLALGLLCTGTAALIFFRVLAAAGATVTSLVNYLIPVMGVLWGALFLGERLSWNAGAALVLILAGIGLVQFGRGRRRA